MDQKIKNGLINCFIVLMLTSIVFVSPILASMKITSVSTTIVTIEWDYTYDCTTFGCGKMF